MDLHGPSPARGGLRSNGERAKAFDFVQEISSQWRRPSRINQTQEAFDFTHHPEPIEGRSDANYMPLPKAS